MRIAYYRTAIDVIGVGFYRIAGRIGQGYNIAEAVEILFLKKYLLLPELYVII